jgi:hypothetical protein
VAAINRQALSLVMAGSWVSSLGFKAPWASNPIPILENDVTDTAKCRSDLRLSFGDGADRPFAQN